MKSNIGTDGNGMKVYNIQKGQIMESPVNITSFNFDKSKVHSNSQRQSREYMAGILPKRSYDSTAR